jgi:hypothetical protein
VSPMCPVQTVTHVSGRSNVELTEIVLSLKVSECMSLLSHFYPNGVENR